MCAAYNPKKQPNPEREAFCQNLLAKMTLEEKVGQMVQGDFRWDQDLKQLTREGRIGSLLTVRNVSDFNEYQHIAMEESRLGIPLIAGNDVIHGYRTIYPIPLALSCTWDTGLVEQVARASIRDGLAHGTSWNYSPMVDIARDPRWGRIAEGAGEDPVLGSQIARAWVRGYQSYTDENGRKAAACVKHFAAYGGAESGKDYNTVDMSERRLREEYLPPYKAAIDEGVMTVMTAFNDLNGVPATANAFLMRRILREEWGFDGVLVSDFDAIGELIHHRVAADHREAALLAVRAGVDIDMMGNAYHFHLADLVREGIVEERLLDESVLRVLNLKYDLGIFEAPYFDENRSLSSVEGRSLSSVEGRSNVSTGSICIPGEDLALAEQAAQESMVLLKNDGALPILESVKGTRGNATTIALIGPIADERASLLGCWKFQGQAEEVETLHEALAQELPAGCKLITAQGCPIDGGEIDYEAVMQAANQADLILLAVGEDDMMSGEAHSRADIHLPGHQNKLVELLQAIGKPLVSVLFTGRPMVIPELDAASNALLLAWHGGTRTACAVCNILFGKINPSGRLTAGFPLHVGQIPVYYAHKSTGRPVESSGVIQFNRLHRSNYLDLSTYPLYPFGYGLSYTQYIYSDLEILQAQVAMGEDVEIHVTVSNRGEMTGTETVQLYIQDCVASISRPVKELKQWRKVMLQSGESQRITFTLHSDELSFLDMHLKPVVEPGRFKVWVGPNAAEGLEGEFEVM